MTKDKRKVFPDLDKNIKEAEEKILKEKRKYDILPPDRPAEKAGKINQPEILKPLDIAREEAEKRASGTEEAEGTGQGLPQAAKKEKNKAREKEIERVLEKGVGEIYLKMPREKQLEFKKAGEETARQINSLFAKGRAKARKILDLIKKWLLLIPGINNFFLEQEAKIKTDEIMRLEK